MGKFHFYLLREAMARPDFLMHWSGKDICLDRETLTDAFREEYINRLADILTKGFWMTTPEEVMNGGDDSWIKYDCPMTCFTEIRLSQADPHTKRYGLLGVGVDRKFVLNRMGGPVHYVRNHVHDCAVSNANAVLRALEKHGDEKAINVFAVYASFMKAMSDKNTDNFLYIEEQEWRIVHTYAEENEGRIIRTGNDKPKYRVPLSNGDCRVIVFPDRRTRELARIDDRLRNFMDKSVLLTVEECGHF